MSDPAFLTVEQVLKLHRMALDRHGGQDGVRDRATLESAVMHPQNVWFYNHGDLFDIAAAHAFHIAESQAFVDGNKRTGIAAALVFLEGNGTIIPEMTGLLHQAMLDIAGRRLAKQGLASLFRSLCR